MPPEPFVPPVLLARDRRGDFVAWIARQTCSARDRFAALRYWERTTGESLKMADIEKIILGRL